MRDVDDQLAAIIQARVGTTVCGGKYRIESVLGIGGMAAVYAGTHRNGRPIAMKLLHPEYSRRADIRKRFLREGQAANAVQHRGVVAVIDDDLTEDGSAFVVMERLEGKTLAQLSDEIDRRFPTRAVLAVGRELCEILAVAHRAGIVHRDIKPENLFLTKDGELKVLDFGLAQLRDAARPTETQTGMVLGTPAYMPPEQASGQTSKIDARTDLWAVGATMFTLLSGELVHQGETAQHFVMLAAMEPARSLATAMPNAHPALIELVDRALAREKERRWQSAESMREAIVSLSELLLGEPETPLMTPVALIQATAPRRAQARPQLPKVEASSVFDDSAPRSDQTQDDNGVDDLTETSESMRAPAAGTSTDDSSAGDSHEDRTRIGVPDFEAAGDSTDTDTNVKRTRRKAIDELPRVGGNSSDTSDDGASSDDVATRVRPGRASSPEQTPLRRQPPVSEDVVDQTALMHHPAARPRAPSAPSYAVAQDRASYPALVPPPRAMPASARTGPGGSGLRYLPIVLAVLLLGLSPIAYFAARGCGGAPAPEARLAPSAAPITSSLESEPAAPPSSLPSSPPVVLPPASSF